MCTIFCMWWMITFFFPQNIVYNLIILHEKLYPTMHLTFQFFCFVKKYPCFDQTHYLIRLTEVASQKIWLKPQNKHIYFLWTPNRFLDHSSHLPLVRQTDSPAHNSCHWLSQCGSVRLVEGLCKLKNTDPTTKMSGKNLFLKTFNL